jgi:aspartyl/asparaginyl beta-hydroxylase/SEC-C motif-containing protein
MLLTDQFTFIHMHKTGGQTLKKVIQSSVKDTHEVGYHFPISELPDQASSTPIVGVVRDPWDWYVSWYAFNNSPNIRNPLYIVLSDGGVGDFKSTITNLVNLGSTQQSSAYYRNALLSILPETLEGNKGVGLTKDCIRNLAKANSGYYSWQFERMYGNLDSTQLHIAKFENLNSDFLSIMSDLGVDQLDQMRSQISATERLNSSRHSHYSNYYDQELNSLITEQDKTLINRYKYHFSDQPSKAIIPITIRQNIHFQKMKGIEKNYLKLTDSLDITPILEQLKAIPSSSWNQSKREKSFEIHKQTKALLLIHDDDFRHFAPTQHALYDEFSIALKPIFELIEQFYDGKGYVVRALFARLKSGGIIPPHTDGLYSLLFCNRVHIPIITTDENLFTVGGETKNLKVGEAWEINNATAHEVRNNSEKDRVHLIVDWVQECTVRDSDRIKAQESLIDMNTKRNDPCPCGSGSKFKKCHGK